MTQIKTVSNIKDENGKITGKREVHTGAPNCLTVETMSELVEILGEELAIQKIKAQLMVDYRATVRRMLDATDANEEFKYAEDEISETDFTDWKPQLRVTKTPEEKALDALGNLPPEVRAAVLAKYEADNA